MRADFIISRLRQAGRWFYVPHHEIKPMAFSILEGRDKTDLSSCLKVSLASGKDEQTLDEVQSLRYHIFYEELAARGKRRNRRLERDIDKFDVHCDHLIVRDEDNGEIIGSCRLLRRGGALKAGGFYTKKEFNIKKLMSVDGEIAEIGRFCIHPAYRKSITVILIWRGIAEYVVRHNVRFIFGCGSFAGKKPKLWARELTWLWRHRLAPESIRPRARRRFYVSMNKAKKEPSDPNEMPALPSLLKAYMRAGALVGDGAVVDKKFNTVDVCVVFRVDHIVERYLPRKPLLEDTPIVRNHQ